MTRVALTITALLFGSTAAYAEVTIPKKYWGEWCATDWETIYKRCSLHDTNLQFTVERNGYYTEHTSCKPTTFRKSNYGEHRAWFRCRSDFDPSYSRRVERWVTGTNGTRLQKLGQERGP
jgi:hypothetical protein